MVEPDKGFAILFSGQRANDVLATPGQAVAWPRATEFRFRGGL